jgi:hypothetical protein
MPIRAPEDYGTNEDGSTTREYCHYCFRDGSFSEPLMTMEQMINKLTIIGMDKQNLSEDESRKNAERTLPDLKRWKRE